MKHRASRVCRLVVVGLAAALLTCAPGTGAAATLPTGFVESTIVMPGALNPPTVMQFAPDGRLFICTQGGEIRIHKNGALVATPFHTIAVDSLGERGLLGLAFDPGFSVNGYLYIYYTATTTPRVNRVSRLTANGDSVVPGSELVIFETDPLTSASNHNGGDIHFGQDGKLYVAVGENATASNAQVLTNVLGKILRINSDGTIPADNPFYGSTTGRNRAIWALGLRNPYRFAVQPGTGRLFVNDVGQNAWEEINDGIAAANYGWPATEGYINPPQPPYRGPLYAYSHADGCAITGGVFYNPAVQQFPSSFTGLYFFTDFCSGWLKTLDPSTAQPADFATGYGQPVDLKVGPDGGLYVLTRGPGGVFRILSSAGTAPSIASHPSSATVGIGGTATFSVGAQGTAPLGYQWRRNGIDIPGATGSSHTIVSATLGDAGSYACVVSNSAGSVTSNSATLTVLNNFSPTATITQPSNGAQYSGGDTISYAGTGVDTEDGVLGGGRFAWKVDFHHDTHTHPVFDWTSGATSGSFLVPRLGETSANVFYRIYLRITDSVGLSHIVSHDVLPRVVTLTFASTRTGVVLTLDGQPIVPPVSIQGVVGMTRVLGVTSPQTAGGIVNLFESWSDGGAPEHGVDTPAASTTYTATFSSFTAGAPALGPPSRGLDFDGEGRGDAFTYDPATGAWGARFGRAGAFASGFGSWSPQWQIFPADFDADRRTDLFLYNVTSGQWFTAINDGAAGFVYTAGTWSPGWQVRVLDLSGDGRSDVFVYNAASGLWFTCVTTTPGSFAFRQEAWSPGWALFPVELNGDNRTDLFLYDRQSGLWFRALSDGAGGFTYRSGAWSPQWEVHPGEFNGDRLTDIFLYSAISGQWFLSINTGDGFVYHSGFWSPGWHLSPADLDADGRDDLFLYNVTTGQWFEAVTTDGAGGFAYATDSWSPGWEVFPTDMTGDGRADVLLYNPASGQFFQCVNTGFGTFSYTSGFWTPALTVIART